MADSKCENKYEGLQPDPVESKSAVDPASISANGPKRPTDAGSTSFVLGQPV